jgi:predicted dehydrogenase
MRCLIIGLGIQGRKRMAIAGPDAVATVDPVAPEARYRHLDEVPLDSFDAALVCTPDKAKHALLKKLLGNGKHVLVEKPLLADNPGQLEELMGLAQRSGAACYTAYNHRFEPHLRRLQELVASGTLGRIHLARFFYGNGTARDVRGSPWRDQGLGVLPDLGSHLLDLVLFLFGPDVGPFRSWACHRFENRAFDHCSFGTESLRQSRDVLLFGERRNSGHPAPAVQCEVSLVSWRNTFTADIVGELGSAHVHCLCKWGPSTLTIRQRVLPSGRPREEIDILEQPDPTWALEYKHFKQLCKTGATNLANDLWISARLNDIASRAVEARAA